MKTNIINTKSILPNSFRFDPSFHLSEAIILGKDLDNVPYEKISIKDTNSKVFLGNIFSRIFVKDKEHGIPYLAASDTVLADINTGRFLSKKQSKELAYLMLKKDWIVITCSGTIGNVTYTNSTFENHIATHDLIRIVPNDAKILKGYLYAFLSSKYGYNQLTQSRFGGVVKHINADHVNGITLPLFPESFQKEVDDLIQESARLREEATEALEEAIKIFDNILGETEFTSNQQTKVLSSKQIFQSYKRFDSQYQIASDVLKAQLQKISGIRTIKIATIASNVFIGNRGKRMYVNNNGVPFMSSSDMMLFNALYYSKLISKKTPGIEDMIVKTGDILISRSGTVGNTIIVGEAYNNVAVSEHAMRLRINKSLIEPEYVYAYLLSSHGQAKLKSLPYGSVIITLGEEFLKDIDLPILDEDKKLKIVGLVEQYTTSMDTAIEKERKAISMVEQEIEKWNN